MVIVYPDPDNKDYPKTAGSISWCGGAAGYIEGCVLILYSTEAAWLILGDGVAIMQLS